MSIYSVSPFTFIDTFLRESIFGKSAVQPPEVRQLPPAILGAEQETEDLRQTLVPQPEGTDKQTIAKASKDEGKRPPQVPALSLPAAPAAGFAVIEELIASTERQRRLDEERHQAFLLQVLQSQQQSQQQFQQLLLQNQQQMFQQQQAQQMQIQEQQLRFQEQQLRFQEQHQLQMSGLASTMAATTKSLESLTGLMEASSANSVSKLPSLDSFIDSSRQDHAHPSPSVDSAIRTTSFAAIQQPTIDQVRAAPNPEDAGRKGIADGGLVKVSNQASIIHFDNSNSGSEFRVLRTAPPSGSAASASQVLAVCVPEDHKFNPESYSEFVIREPGRPEIRVPVTFLLICQHLRILSLRDTFLPPFYRSCPAKTSAAPTNFNCSTLSATGRSVAKSLSSTWTILSSPILS
jgi:hypothetical protein